MTQVIVTFCTCPDQATADIIAHHLVENRMAACVNIVPGLTSVYSWQGQVETVQEHLLLIKSSASAYRLIETAIRNQHPYELPEIISIPVEKGLPEYINWIYSCHTAN